MDSGIIIFVTVVLCIFISATFYYRLYLRKKKHLLKIDKDWIRFSKAIHSNHAEGVITFGKELIWNEHFSSAKLKEMTALIKTFENENIQLREKEKLKELKLLLYNKYLDWNITYPF